MTDRFRLLIFDLDYVVFDCAVVKLRALRQSLVALADDLPHSTHLPDALDVEAAYREYGFRWTEHLELGFDEARRADFERVYQIHEQRLLDEGGGGLFPGLTEILGALRATEVELAVGADARRTYLMSVSDHHGLDHVFDRVLCTEDFGVGGPDEMLDAIMQHYEVLPSETLVLGTRAAQFEAARRLDVLTIACGWGIHPHEGLAEADRSAETLSRLVPVIEEAATETGRWEAS